MRRLTDTVKLLLGSIKSFLLAYWIPLVVLICIALIPFGYSQEWTGFGASTIPTNPNEQPTKKLWDWLGLLVIPAVLAFSALLFSRAERRNEQTIANQRTEEERRIADDRAQDAALQSYLEQMSILLVDKGLRKSEEESEVQHLARAWTLTFLRRLNGERKGVLLRFLYESDLISSKKLVISLTNANLRALDLNYVDLSGAELTEVDLSEATLNGATLSEANLSYANLTRANLLYANLTKAKLLYANLSEANLCTNLRYANLSSAVLYKTDLRNADLSEATLRSTDLRNASLCNATLCNADLRGANLRNTDLTDADLSGTNLRDTNLTNANLSGTNLIGANLSGATMGGANLLGANLSYVTLNDTRYNLETKWPEGFDPAKHEVILSEET